MRRKRTQARVTAAARRLLAGRSFASKADAEQALHALLYISEVAARHVLGRPLFEGVEWVAGERGVKPRWISRRLCSAASQGAHPSVLVE